MNKGKSNDKLKDAFLVRNNKTKEGISMKGYNKLPLYRLYFGSLSIVKSSTSTQRPTVKNLMVYKYRLTSFFSICYM